MIHTRIRRDASDMLAGALVEYAGGNGQVIRRRGTSWASATFTGMRHKIELEFTGADAVAAGRLLLSGLSEREFTLPGHIVIDIDMVQQMEAADILQLEIEALTVEDV